MWLLISSTGKRQTRSIVLQSLKRSLHSLRYYITTLRYIADDFFSPDEMQVKKAKKALLDSIDQYCLEELKKIKSPVTK